MKRLLVLPLLLSSVATFAAYAQDAFLEPNLPAHDWDGFYAGMNFGHGVGEGSSIFTLDKYDHYEGFAGGIQAGYLFQTGSIVWGLETDYQLSSTKHRRALGAGIDGEAGIEHYGTTRAKLGYAYGAIVPYVTSGLAYGRMGYVIPKMDYKDSGQAWGFTYGVGLDWAVSEKLSVKAEYLQLHLEGPNVTLSGITQGMTSTTYTARAGINWHF